MAGRAAGALFALRRTPAETDSVGEPAYGVAETDSVGEPDYGVPETTG